MQLSIVTSMYVVRHIVSLMVLACIIGCSPKSGDNNTRMLFDIKDRLDTADVQAAQDVKISIMGDDNGNAIKMECSDKNPVPVVIIKEGTDKWMLSDYKFIAVDITNQGTEDLFVECQLAGNGWYSGCQNIRAGEKRTIRAYIQRIDEYPSYLDKKFIGMDAYPGGIIKAFWWTPLRPGSIHDISIRIVNPAPENTLLISNIKAEGSINPPLEEELNDDYYPIVDEFGQLKHKDWPGKIHSLDELLESKETEAHDITSNPPPADWNKYGGWLKGPQLKATGHFRTEKRNGTWWLVDPEGRLFWANGMCEVSYGNSTVITEREHYFTDLPDTNRYREFYSTRTRRIPKGYYKGVRTITDFQITHWNLLRKYGENWKEEIEQRAGSRLKSWGINNIGSWSGPDMITAAKTPYTEMLSTGRARRIEGSEGPWYKFPDPFDESFLEVLKAGEERIQKSAADPFCIGYYVDNEFHWGDDSYLGKAVVQSGKNQPAKIVMRKYLQKKYNTINALNSNWQTSYGSWDHFMESTALPVAEPPLVFGSSTTGTETEEYKARLQELKSYVEDMRVFSAVIADEYYTKIKKFLKERAPHSLYMGSKFDFVYYPNQDTSGSWIVSLSAQHCDVIPFDRYSFTNSDFIPIDADKPFIIGEWGMGALDRGLLHYGLRFAESQENRAELYTHYVESSLRNPYIVGVQWFKYYDQPVTGRTDGEDYNMGFLDICDVPYPEMVTASRKIGKNMYEIRSSANE